MPATNAPRRRPPRGGPPNAGGLSCVKNVWRGERDRRPACKPGSVPRRSAATAIYLARRLPGGSSDLPGGRRGPDQPCPLIWSCSRWGLPSQPVTRLLVGSYIKGPRPPHLFTLTRKRGQKSEVRQARTAGLSHRPSQLALLTSDLSSWRYPFCCTFPVLRPATRGAGRRPRTVGVTHHRVLWSPDFPPPGRAPGLPKQPRFDTGRRPSGRPAACLIIANDRRTVSCAAAAAVGGRSRRRCA
jgi:hypothetical protein